MKKLLINAFICLSFVTVPVTLLQTGCTTSQQRVTYNTLFTLADGVNRAYSSYNDQVVAGKATFSTNVAKAYNDFQAGLSVAVQASSVNYSAVAPQSLVDLANAVYMAIKQYTK